MKPKTCLILLFLTLASYSVYIYYSGLTINDPVNYNGMNLQKKYWTITPLNMLGFFAIIIGFLSCFFYSKKNKD